MHRDVDNPERAVEQNTTSDHAVILSIVIPVYNEERLLGKCLDEACAFVPSLESSYEIIVVDDGSSDGSVELVKKRIAQGIPLRLVRHRNNYGKGWAVRTGVLNARGKYIVFMDTDLSTPLSELGNVLDAFRQGYHVVMGSRHILGAETLTHQTRMRELMGVVYYLIASRILRLQVHDITCGFKGFTARAAALVFSLQRIRRWSFDAEILYICRKLGLRCIEIPVQWSNRANTKVKLIKDTIVSFCAILAILINSALGKYNTPVSRS
jgi:dolichyl-phosphate beta-glucosyltransferase